MFTDDIKKEIVNMAVGILLLSMVMAALFAVFGFWDISVLYGALLGGGFALLNFVLLAISVQKAVASNPKTAQGVMGLSYMGRYILTGAVVILGIKAPVFNYVAVVIPLIFPKIIITLTNLLRRKKVERS